MKFYGYTIPVSDFQKMVEIERTKKQTISSIRSSSLAIGSPFFPNGRGRSTALSGVYQNADYVYFITKDRRTGTNWAETVYVVWRFNLSDWSISKAKDPDHFKGWDSFSDVKTARAWAKELVKQ